MIMLSKLPDIIIIITKKCESPSLPDNSVKDNDNSFAYTRATYVCINPI